MKSNLTLKFLYEVTYGNIRPFEERNDASDFLMSAIVADLLEKEYSENRISMWELYLYFLDGMGIKMNDLHNHFSKALENVNIDALLYQIYNTDELFDHCLDYTEFMLEQFGVDLNKCANGEALFRASLIPMLFPKQMFIDVLKDKCNSPDLTVVENYKKATTLIELIFSPKAKTEINKELTEFAKQANLIKPEIVKFRKQFLMFCNKRLTDELTFYIVRKERIPGVNETTTTRPEFNPIKRKKSESSPQKAQSVMLQQVQKISDRVIGQELAVAKVKNNILSASVGFKDENSPIASFLLTGPTGVGKTETAKAVADACFNGKFFVVDMSTYKNDIDVSRLLGGSPNYIGYNDPNAFCNFLKENPDSVILFDEIEKGHPSCLDLLMRILDEGEFINSKGEVISLKNTVIFCTTNVTQNKVSVCGFGKDQKVVEEEITTNTCIKKELAGRFTEIIEYKQLSKSACKQIAKELFLKQVIEKFEKNNPYQIKIKYTDGFLDKIVEGANTNLFGARDIKKSIKKNLIGPVSNYLLENQLFDQTIVISETGIEVENVAKAKTVDACK